MICVRQSNGVRDTLGTAVPQCKKCGEKKDGGLENHAILLHTFQVFMSHFSDLLFESFHAIWCKSLWESFWHFGWTFLRLYRVKFGMFLVSKALQWTNMTQDHLSSLIDQEQPTIPVGEQKNVAGGLICLYHSDWTTPTANKPPEKDNRDQWLWGRDPACLLHLHVWSLWSPEVLLWAPTGSQWWEKLSTLSNRTKLAPAWKKKQ